MYNIHYPRLYLGIQIMKLWEIILIKLGFMDAPQPPKPIPEFEIYNPLKVKCNGVVSIDHKNYTVMAIEELTFNTCKMTTYNLENVENVFLRVAPSKRGYRTLILKIHDQFEYNKDFHDILNDESKILNLDDDELNVHDQFWRVNDVGISYNAESKEISMSGSPEIRCAEFSIEFWDYSRMAEINGAEVEEFVYIEMNKKNGWFIIYRGTEAITENIEVF